MGKRLLQKYSSYRIVLLALCLLITLIVALFVYTSSWTSTCLRKNIVDTMMENVSFLRMDFTDSVRETEKAMNYLLRSSEVTSFFTFSKTYTQVEYYTSLSRLRKLLSLMRSSNSFLNSYVIHYPDLELSMDAEKGIISYDGDKLMNVLETIHQNHTHLVYDPDDGSFCLYYASSQEAPAYVLQAIISREQIQAALSTFSQEKDKYSLLYFSEDQTLLYSGNVGFSLAPVVEALSGENGERIQMNLWLEGKTYILIGNHSPALGLTWAQLYPISQIQASNQAIARVTMKITLGKERVIVRGIRPEEHFWGPISFPCPINWRTASWSAYTCMGMASSIGEKPIAGLNPLIRASPGRKRILPWTPGAACFCPMAIGSIFLRKAPQTYPATGSRGWNT